MTKKMKFSIEKKKYKWTGSTSLGAYLVSATSSHYDWAYKLIKKCLKTSFSAIVKETRDN